MISLYGLEGFFFGVRVYGSGNVVGCREYGSFEAPVPKMDTMEHDLLFHYRPTRT